VLSYRECTDGKAIPDAEWRQRVAAGRAPLPPFAQSFRR
jgi:hypothetical protein